MTDEQRAASLRFDTDIYAAACELAKSAPLDLNEWHFEQLAIISKGIEADARAAQRQAQLAFVAAHTPAVQTKSAEPAPRTLPQTKDEWLLRFGKKPVTGAVLFKVIEDVTDTLIDILKTHKTRADELEQANKDLQARVLELEASAAAARTVTQHADR